MPSMQEAHRAFNMTGGGCIFEHLGRIPEKAYTAQETFQSPLEKAVYDNDVNQLNEMIQQGHAVTIRLKVGEMSCIEYAAMKGYAGVLKVLLQSSVNASELKEYFSLPDVVERAYLISMKKKVYFEREALAEANRYEAALFTAIIYNQAECVSVLLERTGSSSLRPHSFLTNDNTQETLSAEELAKIKGHTECYAVLMNRQPPGDFGVEAS